MNTLKIERPQPLNEIAADHIREAVIRGDFGLGEQLKEQALTEMLGISKTPIREALATLKHEGLLQGDTQKGVRVFELTASQLSQLCIYRITLETAALDMAFAADPEGLQTRLPEICSAMDTALRDQDYTLYLQLDRRFHDAFFELSGNQFLRDGYQSVSHKVSTLRTHLSQTRSSMDKSYVEHVEIAELLKSGDCEGAKQVLRAQINRGSELAHEVLKPGRRRS